MIILQLNKEVDKILRYFTKKIILRIFHIKNPRLYFDIQKYSGQYSNNTMQWESTVLTNIITNKVDGSC
jgi:hypothetical protein